MASLPTAESNCVQIAVVFLQLILKIGNYNFELRMNMKSFSDLEENQLKSFCCEGMFLKKRLYHDCISLNGVNKFL
jgi:hypothetical protein